MSSLTYIMIVSITGYQLRRNYMAMVEFLVTRIDVRIASLALKGGPEEMFASMDDLDYPSIEYKVKAAGTRMTYRYDPIERSLLLQRNEGYLKYDVDRLRLDIKAMNYEERIQAYDCGEIRSYGNAIPRRRIEQIFTLFALEPLLKLTKE